MYDFLNNTVLENTIGEYLLTLSVVLLMFFFKTRLSKNLAMLIAKTILKKKNNQNRALFCELVLAPIGWFVLTLTIIIALYRLHFPEAINATIYKTNVHNILESLANVALISSFIWLCNRLMMFVAHLLHTKALETNDRTDDQLIIFFRDFFKVIIWIIGVLLILKFSFGFALSNVFTGLSLVSAALALAFRESLENLIASFIIFFDKPFTIGDIVKVLSVTGTVEKIGLRSTRIRTTEKTFVTVPNKQMVDTVLDNQSLRTQRNVLTILELGLETNPEKLNEIITGIEKLMEHEAVIDQNVYLSNTGRTAHTITVEYFISMNLSIKEFFKLRQTINLSIIALLHAQSVRMVV